MAMAGALLVGVPVGATVGFVVGRRGGESWEPVRILEEGEPEVGRHYRFEQDGRPVTVRVQTVEEVEHEGRRRQRVRGHVIQKG